MRVTDVHWHGGEQLAVSVYLVYDREHTQLDAVQLIEHAWKVIAAGKKFRVSFNGSPLWLIRALWDAFEEQSVVREMNGDRRGNLHTFSVTRHLSPCSVITKGEPVRRRGTSCA